MPQPCPRIATPAHAGRQRMPCRPTQRTEACEDRIGATYYHNGHAALCVRACHSSKARPDGFASPSVHARDAVSCLETSVAVSTTEMPVNSIAIQHKILNFQGTSGHLPDIQRVCTHAAQVLAQLVCARQIPGWRCEQHWQTEIQPNRQYNS